MVSKKNELEVVTSKQGVVAVPVEPTPMSIMQLAVTQGADVAQLEKLMDLQERWEQREAKKAYDAALAKFKSENITITRGSQVHYDHRQGGGSTDYKFATLHMFLEAVTPKLSENGLSLTWRTNQESNMVRVTAVLSHELGHSETTTMQAAPDTSGKKNAIQAIGSTVSYLQRYTGLSITGVTTTDMDDDGQGADNFQRQIPAENQQGRDLQGGGQKTNGPDSMEEKPAEPTYFEKCMEYVDNFSNGTLQEWSALTKSGRIEEAKKNMTEEERVKFDSQVRSVQSIFDEEGVQNDG